MISDTIITAIFAGLPATIAAIAAAVVTVKQGNKASARTDEGVAAVKDAVVGSASKLEAVHDTVNGNFTAVSDKLERANRDNASLREELARQKPRRPKKQAER